MQNFTELYNSIKNPLFNGELLRKLPDYRGKDLYFKLIKQNSKDKHFKDEYDYRENLYALLFNVWKNNILSLSKQQLLDLKQRGSYQGNIYELYDSLSQQDKNVDTYEELQQVFNRFPLVEQYCWYNYFKNNTSFVHVYSRELRAKQEDYMDIKHRLYINPEPNDTYRLLGLFTIEALKEEIPFYYKFDDGIEKKRDDTIVMYASDENLLAYINILQSIGNRFPKLISRCNKPPILTGYIDNWIGYATEPTERMKEKYGSYNNMVTELLEDAINEAYSTIEKRQTTKRWLAKKLNKSSDEIDRIYAILPSKYPNPYLGFISLGCTPDEYMTEVFDKIKPSNFINFNPKIYNYFKKTSVLKALVTLASPQYTNELQSKLKLKEFYSEILYVKDFKSYNKKDCYKKIAKDFNIDFAEICVMGDSYINDILPAQELGCKVILISNKSRNSNIKTVESIEEFIENGGIEKYYE